MTNYRTFFQTATQHPRPHDYQVRLACGERGEMRDDEWLTRGATPESRLISVSTGMGKTAAVTLAWLWNRIVLADDTWPRRLVYCLPMRTLVEQTESEINQWLTRLAAAYPDNDQLQWLKERSPIVLMGGEEISAERREWDIHPDKPAIIVGTQDMLISRALNRGYGMARARWPMHFALLNNDALWVMDETQLMDVGLATSAQLQSFRGDDSHTWWMSATLQPDWLRSPETAGMMPGLRQGLISAEPQKEISKRLVLEANLDERHMAQLIADKNTMVSSKQTTLVIVNTVRRAVEIYDTLIKDKVLVESCDIHLAHSRFRPADRRVWRRGFLSRDAAFERPRIIVATQVVEAGVDISADILITDLAPWTSLVQRFGRAARYGGEAEVIVVDRTDKKTSLPYEETELAAARDELAKLDDVSLESLKKHEESLSDERRGALYPYEPAFLLMRHEMDELFDTSPDLSGADIDISRYIRTGEEYDCQMGWIEAAPEPDFQPASTELCSVPIGEVRNFLKGSNRKLWRWDYLTKAWVIARNEDIYPGLIVLALAGSGGYDPLRGFDISSRKPVPPVAAIISASDIASNAADYAEEDEALSETKWETIAEHGENVSAILRNYQLPLPDIMEVAARWHDLGKAHPAFQSLLIDAPSADIAKAPPTAWRRPPEYRVDEEPRRGFRHELASMLALLDLRSTQPWLRQLAENDFDLLLYLIAAHHGKVRASLQASPYDQEFAVREEGAPMPIRGVMEGDIISGAPFDLPDMRLTLAPATIGLSSVTGRSWMERVSDLLAAYGPFKLAFLETVLRAADATASRKE